MKYIVNFLLLSVVWTSALAQKQSEQELFNSGLGDYQAERYNEAQGTFLRLLQEFPTGFLSTGTRLMLAKSYYKLSDYTRAEFVCKNFFSKHPGSSYVDDMHYLLGNTMYQSKKFTEAITEWQWVLRNSRDERLKKKSFSYIYQTMYHFLGKGEIETLMRNYPDKDFQGIGTVAIARQLIDKKDRRQSRAMLKTFLQNNPNHQLANSARALIGLPQGSGDGVSGGSAKSGFVYLKPIRGETRAVANDIEQGMQYALAEYKNRNPRSKLTMQTMEIEPTVIGAIKAAREAAADLDPACIFGPIDSDQAAGISIISGYEKFPYIIPLSSQTGLTDISDYAFQINPDAQTKGRFIGSYAAGSLKAKNIAILAPQNEYGMSFVNSFTREVESNGGKVVENQWYFETTRDFTQQFRAIWRAGIYAAFRDSVLGVDPAISEGDLSMKYRQYLEDTFEPLRRLGSIDSTKVPSEGIDALLVVTRSSEFIQYIAPQFAFNNIRTTLLGNEGWNDPQQLRKYKTYLEGMVYIAAGYHDPNSSRYRLFTNRFRTTMKKSPEVYHVIGYDVMKWVLENYSEGMSRGDLRNRLAKTDRFQGIIETIQFNKTPRVNSELTVLKLNRGQIIKLN